MCIYRGKVIDKKLPSQNKTFFLLKIRTPRVVITTQTFKRTLFLLVTTRLLQPWKKNNRNRDARTVFCLNSSKGFMHQQNFSFAKENEALLFPVMSIFPFIQTFALLYYDEPYGFKIPSQFMCDIFYCYFDKLP
jgi:hypothetical protein